MRSPRWRRGLGLGCAAALVLVAACARRPGETLGREESARLLRVATDSVAARSLATALSALQRLTRASDTPAEAYATLADVYDHLNWPDLGLACFDELRRLKPEEPQILYYAAHFRSFFPAQYDQAAALFEAALARDPERRLYYDGYSRFLHEKRDFARELSCLDEGLERFPADAAFSTQRGLAQLRLGEVDAAAMSFRALTDADPADPYAWLNLGYLEFGRGNLDQAAQCFAKVLALDGKNTEALYNVGRIALRRGDSANALRATRALKAAVHAR